jgi:(E)-4-hydroxy-3-methylbut-2-enyl-diphosphate synthase
MKSDQENSTYHVLFPAWKPQIVMIGDVGLGGGLPVRIQSMTNTPTPDTRATVAQCIRMAEAGCELIRITAQNIAEAENLAIIKKEIKKAGFNVPLIADVHFNPAVAEVAARLVEKVRINPGNYADKRTAKQAYSDAEYQIELERITENLSPLLQICRQYGTAIRIGTNHGSLSGRIVQRYGDTPEGMAESAMEFVRICNQAGFSQLVLSMKSSNVRVMVAATRLLVQKMIAENMQFPLHLGVTEAGNGLEGRIKSTAGIGTLLAEGIGDTIRVSLTEAPENEIPVAKQIAKLGGNSKIQSAAADKDSKILDGGLFGEGDEQVPVEKPDKIFDYRRRISFSAGSIGGGQLPVVLSGSEVLFSINENLQPEGNHGSILPHFSKTKNPDEIHYWQTDAHSFLETITCRKIDFNTQRLIPVVEVQHASAIALARTAVATLDAQQQHPPLILSFSSDDENISHFAVEAATMLSPLLNDGLCDGIYLKNNKITESELASVAFGILQATRSRITQTEYIGNLHLFPNNHLAGFLVRSQT